MRTHPLILAIFFLVLIAPIFSDDDHHSLSTGLSAQSSVYSQDAVLDNLAEPSVFVHGCVHARL